MNTPDPAPSPAPPAAMPWYRSPIIVSAVALIIVRFVNHLKTAYHIDLTVFGIDANTGAEYVIDALVAIGGWVIIRARAVQVHAPKIVFTTPKGDDVKKASMFLLAGVLGLLMTASSLSGCALLNSSDAAAANAIQTGIELVTSVYIQHKGGGSPAGDLAAAQQVKSVAVELQGLITGNLTVAQFNTAASAYIGKLPPAQQIIASALLQQIDLYFAQQIQNNSLLKANAVAAANIVFNDVIAACAIYGA